MTEPSLDLRDRLRLAEAFRLAEAIRPEVWPGWAATPFPVLLVGEEAEWFIGDAELPEDFMRAGSCSILRQKLWTRPRQFDTKVTAAFPAFEQEPIVVIGRPEATGRNSTEWILTVLHEHFHQYQMGDPGYASAVDALGLSDGDGDAMWMLNYGFPYESREVAAAFSAASEALWHSVVDREQRSFWSAYAQLLEVLSDPDRRYLSFQLWQEGVARYVELRVGEVAAERYTVSMSFQDVADVRSFAAVAEAMRCSILAELEQAELGSRGRKSFYAFGAGLALLLDEHDSTWKSRYMTEGFSLFGRVP